MMVNTPQISIIIVVMCWVVCNSACSSRVRDRDTLNKLARFYHNACTIEIQPKLVNFISFCCMQHLSAFF